MWEIIFTEFINEKALLKKIYIDASIVTYFTFKLLASLH